VNEKRDADIDSLIDTSTLGSEVRVRGNASFGTWPLTWATPGAERMLALEAVRLFALNWGFTDPDQELRRLGWQKRSR